MKSQSYDEAKIYLLESCKSARFEIEYGHSGNYQACIGGVSFSQLPSNKELGFISSAFSDGSTTSDNNHGRIFGPYYFKGAYVFVGAFSREAGGSHNFISFNMARDAFAYSLNRTTQYKLYTPDLSPDIEISANGHTTNLDNKIDLDTYTTADHDGQAVVLVRPFLTILYPEY